VIYRTVHWHPGAKNKSIRWDQISQIASQGWSRYKAQPVVSREQVSSTKPHLAAIAVRYQRTCALTVTYIIQIKRVSVRSCIGPCDESNSDDHAKNTQGSGHHVVQPPCPGNGPRPRDQGKGSDNARKHRVCDWECDTPNCRISHYILVVLCMNCRQNNPCAQRNSNAHCAVNFILSLACW
jgi:hypothetical protein